MEATVYVIFAESASVLTVHVLERSLHLQKLENIRNPWSYTLRLKNEIKTSVNDDDDH